MSNPPHGLPGDGPIRRFERREDLGWLPHGWIAGLVLSNDTTDATNDIAISKGVCRSTVNIVDGAEASARINDQRDICIPVNIIKQLDVSWAPENYDPDGYSGGGRSGMLNPVVSISNTTWHIYAVGGGDCQDDIIAVASATQADVLDAIQAAGGFTAYRRIGSIIRASGTILAFTQRGDDFDLVTPVVDVNVGSPGTSANTGTLASVPNGIVVRAKLNLGLDAATRAYVSALTSTDQAAASVPTSPIANISIVGVSGSPQAATHVEVWTNTSRQFRYRVSDNVALAFATKGWLDRRDRDA